MAGDLSYAETPLASGTGVPILHVMETEDEVAAGDALALGDNASEGTTDFSCECFVDLAANQPADVIGLEDGCVNLHGLP